MCYIPTTCNSPAQISCLILTRRRPQLHANFDLKLAIRDLSPAFIKEGMQRTGSKGAKRPHCKAELSVFLVLSLFVWSGACVLPCWWPIDSFSFNWRTARGKLHVLSIMPINFFKSISQYTTERWLIAIVRLKYKMLRPNSAICPKFYTGVQVCYW